MDTQSDMRQLHILNERLRLQNQILNTELAARDTVIARLTDQVDILATKKAEAQFACHQYSNYPRESITPKSAQQTSSLIQNDLWTLISSLQNALKEKEAIINELASMVNDKQIRESKKAASWRIY